jgi:toxin ParE1/3/4
VIELRLSEAAAVSIVEQSDYYRQVAGAAVADRWELAAAEAFRSLLHNPERGAACRFRNAALKDLRWILMPGFPRHLLFYRYNADEEILLIVQVLHGARDIEVLLKEDSA